jgi:adenosyl cobinamide kinase/adenosyl cobinamide phosphate guanylyltransferase
MLTMLLGGARSGKSSLAVEMARRSGGAVVYLATSPRIDGDNDLDDRITRHVAERPEHWATIEEELDLAAAITSADDDAMLIIDCLTTWLGNQLHHGRSAVDIEAETAGALTAALLRSGDTIVISNEVGLGIVPAEPLSRGYRDLLGRVNQCWAAAADRPLLLVAGRAMPLSDPWDFLA